MSGTLSATTAASLAPVLRDVTSALSLGSTGWNMYNQYQNQQYQDRLRSFAQDPAKLSAYAARFTQPLTAGLQRGVANEAQSYLASRGLSDSPQISEQVEAQAIAPYIQQNQQAGYQNALQALNLGGGAIPPAFQQQQSLSALAKAFSQLGLPGAGSSGPGALPTLADYIRTMGTQAPQLNLPGAPSQQPPLDTSGWGTDWGAPPDLSALFAPTSPDPAAAPAYEPDYGILAANQGGG